MARGQEPSFWKILMKPSSSQLVLPLSFVEKYLGSKVIDNPIIRSGNGGYIWKVKMKKIGDSYCFAKGWSNVVKDVKLDYADFLVFRYVGACVFTMLVYSPNGCEKILTPKLKDEGCGTNVVDVEDDVYVDVDVDEDDGIDDDDVEVDVDVDYDDDVEEDEDDEDDDVDEDNDDVELVDDDDDGDDADEEEDYDGGVDGDNGDPFFVVTIPRYHNFLRLQQDFVALAGIATKKTILLKTLDGYEKEMHVRSEKQHHSTRYHLSYGWSEFRRKNDILEGDECVFKYITSEDKMCLAKINRKRRPAKQPSPATEAPAERKRRLSPSTAVNMGDDVEEDEDYNEDKDVDPNFDDDVEDGGNVDEDVDGDDVEEDSDVDGDVDGDDVEEDGDVNEDVDGDDGDPFFEFFQTNNYKLRMRSSFVAATGLDTKETIVFKNLDGHETEIPVRSMKERRKIGYHFSLGWSEILQRNNISKGDKCVLKYIRNEDKMCLAKVTKKTTPAKQPPPANKGPAEKKRGRSPSLAEILVAENAKKKGRSPSLAEILVAENAKRGRPQQIAKNMDDDVEDENDVEEDEHDDDVEDVENDGAGGDPFFELPDCISRYNKYKLRLPHDFVESAGIDAKETIVFKNLDGSEKELILHSVTQVHLTRYHFSAGWPDILQRNDISDGDNCVIKFIKSEDKMCVTKVAKKKTPVVKHDITTRRRSSRQEEKKSGRSPPLVGVTVADNVKKRGQLLQTAKNMDDVVEEENDVEEEEHDDDVEEENDVEEEENDDDVEEVNDVEEEEHDDDVEEVNDVEEEEHDDSVENDGADGDPFFELPDRISKSNKYLLRFPLGFVELTGIDASKTIVFKNLDGSETEIILNSMIQRHSTRYHFSKGWPEIQHRNDISEGDRCLIKYIKSEDKLSVAKVTKINVKKKRERPRTRPLVEITAAENVKSGRPPHVKITAVEGVKRKRGRPQW